MGSNYFLEQETATSPSYPAQKWIYIRAVAAHRQTVLMPSCTSGKHRPLGDPPWHAGPGCVHRRISVAIRLGFIWMTYSPSDTTEYGQRLRTGVSCPRPGFTVKLCPGLCHLLLNQCTPVSAIARKARLCNNVDSIAPDYPKNHLLDSTPSAVQRRRGMILLQM